MLRSRKGTWKEIRTETISCYPLQGATVFLFQGICISFWEGRTGRRCATVFLFERCVFVSELRSVVLIVLSRPRHATEVRGTPELLFFPAKISVSGFYVIPGKRVVVCPRSLRSLQPSIVLATCSQNWQFKFHFPLQVPLFWPRNGNNAGPCAVAPLVPPATRMWKVERSLWNFLRFELLLSGPT